MSLKHGLLGLLDYGAMSGYELCKAFEDSLAFFWQATTSQVYRDLGAMEQAGWLSAELVVQTGKPNKKVYSLTEAGRRELVRWLARPVTPKELETKNSFLMQLFFSARNQKETTLANLQRFRDINARALAQLEASDAIEEYSAEAHDPQAARYWQLAARFGHDYYRMCVTWADGAIRELMEANQ